MRLIRGRDSVSQTRKRKYELWNIEEQNRESLTLVRCRAIESPYSGGLELLSRPSLLSPVWAAWGDILDRSWCMYFDARPQRIYLLSHTKNNISCPEKGPQDYLELLLRLRAPAEISKIMFSDWNLRARESMKKTKIHSSQRTPVSNHPCIRFDSTK